MFVKVFLFNCILLNNQILGLFQLPFLRPPSIPPAVPLLAAPLSASLSAPLSASLSAPLSSQLSASVSAPLSVPLPTPPPLPISNVTRRCVTQPNTSMKVEISVRECQSEVQNTIFVEALKLLRESQSAEWIESQNQPQHDYQQHSSESFRSQYSSYDNQPSSYYPPHTGLPIYPPLSTEQQQLHSLSPNWPFESKRSFSKRSDDYDYSQFRHSTTVPFPDKRIAGCLLHCVFVKNNAVNKLGWPTLDGLVNFYTEGVNEHGYFMATLRASDYCLKGASYKYNINRMLEAGSALSCDIAFDVFDCISDQIIEYCNDRPMTLTNISNQLLRPLS